MTIEQLFNGYSQNGRISLAKVKELFQNYAGENGRFEASELRTLAQNGVDASWAVSSADRGPGCKGSAYRRLKDSDIEKSNPSDVAEEAFYFASLAKGQDVTSMDLKTFKTFFGYNSKNSYLNRYPGRVSCTLPQG